MIPLSSPPADAPVRPLGRTGRAWRWAALAIGVGLVVRGTVIGNDVEWPFAPMSQFAFRVGTDGEIRATLLEARNATGEVLQVPITRGTVGMARAEIEGQQPRFVREPELLGALARAYARLHPDRPALTTLWLRERVTTLHEGRAAGVHVETVTTWSAGD